ncbi:PREDICTED: uncharacterized protein LOC104601170 [Nelumbo nucifera]|uniref:Uncharacterized protein LOC104601170 n=2 Tax=Nelumbo nucifera TaxID=4432 RepID=A0A1U8AK93_NELNU|nr:PREDICTED: uncharacterized protein LOC104601170 [Nelumbo nucifera]DAD28378.1 TPA_asm: hypothetical protein HUJ06_029846 [Nelumbo nucifera]
MTLSLPYLLMLFPHLVSTLQLLFLPRVSSPILLSSFLSVKVMGRQTKTKKSENLGTGKVTPVQVAFIVDRYLCDNNYAQTRSIFRTEASTLISKTQVREAPKSLLSLGAILDEYICLKEQKMMVEQERCRLEQEKFRVEKLLQGMQDVMQAYNSSGSISPPPSAPATKSMALIPQSDQSTTPSPTGYPMYSTPITNSAPRLTNVMTEPTSLSTPVTNFPPRNKRKGSRLVSDVPPTAKRSCSQVPNRLSPIGGTNIPLLANNTARTQGPISRTMNQSSPNNVLQNGSPVQGSSVAKSLFKHPSPSAPTNSPSPKTPPQALLSHIDKTVSPLESSSLLNSADNSSAQEVIPTIVSPEKVNGSPFKHVAYYSVERNHYISSSPVKTNLKRPGKRDHVKGRLDFDGSDVSMSSQEPMAAEISTSGTNGGTDIFDMDIPNFDIFGADFSLSELLVDIDLDCEGNAFPCQSTLDASIDTTSGSPSESQDGALEAGHVLSELSSTVTEVLSEKDINIQGQDSLTSVKSITKCIRILSPVKSRRSSLSNQENLLS